MVNLIFFLQRMSDDDRDLGVNIDSEVWTQHLIHCEKLFLPEWGWRGWVFITAVWAREESSPQRAGEEEEGSHQGQLQWTQGRHPDPAGRQVQQSSNFEEGERVHRIHEAEKWQSLKRHRRSPPSKRSFRKSGTRTDPSLQRFYNELWIFSIDQSNGEG